MHFLRQLFFVFALLLHTTLWASADQYERFRENGKYGVKNTTSGEILISAQYEYIGWSDGSFTVINDLIGAQQNEKWALINLDGNRVSDHIYTNLRPFIEDLFIAAIRSNGSILVEYGLINNRGKTVLSHNYSKLEPLGNTLLATQKIANNYKKGLLDKNGKAIIPITHESIHSIESGYLAVQNDNGLSALYSEKGIAITAFEYESIERLSDRLFLVKFYNRQGLMDKTGRLVVPPIYKNIQVSGDKARALPFDKWDFYKNNQFQKSFYFDNLDFLSPGNFAVTSGNKIAVIDEDEQYITYQSKLKIASTSNGYSIIEDSQSGYRGVMNEVGRMILPTNYDSIVVFEQIIFGQIRNQESQSWSIFGHRGRKKSLYEYNSFSAPKAGLIKASRNGKHGFINATTGKESSPFLYDSIAPFKQDLAIVAYQESFGVINRDGHWVITPYSDSLSIGDDFIFSKQGSENKIYDLGGSALLSTYNSVSILPQGYYTKEKESLALFNFNGDRLLENDYDTIQVINEDLYLLKRDNRSFFYKPSNSADFELDNNIEHIGANINGYFPVLIDDQWGFIDEQANLKIANRYEATGQFSEGLFTVQVIGKWAYLDKDENIVIQPIYVEAGPFENGLAVVKNESGYGFINKTGNVILSETYSSIKRLDTFILLERNGLYGLADTKGKLIWDPQFDKITLINNEYFLAERSGFKGVINLQGEDIVPVAYKKIIQLGDQFIGSEPSDWLLIDIK